MYKANIIEPATAEWALLVVVVPEDDGSHCIWADYHKLKAVTICDPYLFPRMEKFVDALGDATVF